MSVVELSPLVKTIDVRRSCAEAFRLFSEEITAWWPLKTRSRAKDSAGEVTVRVDFETRVGGRIYETLNTGEQRDWGEVLVYEPANRLAFIFQMGRPKDKSGEVEVRFEPLDDRTCRVTLTHSHWERFGDEGAVIRGRFADGWEDVFVERFGSYAGTITRGPKP